MSNLRSPGLMQAPVRSWVPEFPRGAAFSAGSRERASAAAFRPAIARLAGARLLRRCRDGVGLGRRLGGDGRAEQPRVHLERAALRDILGCQRVLVGGASGKQGGEQEEGWKESAHHRLAGVNKPE